MAAPSQRTVAAGTALASLLLLLAAPPPGTALHQLQTGGTAADATAPLVALVALTAWTAAAWLSLTVVATSGAHLPGLAGRACGGVSRRVAPAALRRGVEVALGLTVALGVGGAPSALASGAPADGTGSTLPAVSLDWPGAEVATSPEPAAGPPVVVQQGDTLWDLAEQDLAARSGTAPTAGEVARTWPSWWAANRDVIGNDPHLIRPGTRLSPPVP